MKAPSLTTVDELVYGYPGTLPGTRRPAITHTSINSKWVLSRPLGLYGIRHRLRLAWMVFTGQADAFVWPEGQ